MRSTAPSPLAASALEAQIAVGGPALVALSGGVDSAVVAALAARALGPRVLAATVVNDATPSGEVETARAVAAGLGVRHREVTADTLADARYRENGSDRCYRCRSVETTALRRLGAAEGIRQFLDGVHCDDLGEDRPGLRAMDEAGFQHPLLLGGWGKAEVRRHARALGLPNADRPSNACLASRVARGEPITSELLRRVDRAEALLRARGFRQVRVRAEAGGARLEVDAEAVPRFGEPGLLEELTHGLEALGFRSVTVEPRGYRAREQLPVLR